MANHRMVVQASTLSLGESTWKRMDRVVRFLTGKGYNADCQQVEGGYLLRTHNCPYHDISPRITS